MPTLFYADPKPAHWASIMGIAACEKSASAFFRCPQRPAFAPWGASHRGWFRRRAL